MELNVSQLDAQDGKTFKDLHETLNTAMGGENPGDGFLKWIIKR